MTVEELIAHLQDLPEDARKRPVGIWSAGALQQVVASRDVARHTHGLNPACTQLMTWKPWVEEVQAPTPPASAAAPAPPTPRAARTKKAGASRLNTGGAL